MAFFYVQHWSIKFCGNPIIPFHGVAECCCWSQSQLHLRARAGYSLDKSPAYRRALTDEQHGVQYLAQEHFDMQPGPGFEPVTFWSLVNLLYPLSYSRPQLKHVVLIHPSQTVANSVWVCTIKPTWQKYFAMTYTLMRNVGAYMSNLQ